ncbi:MAG: hypothetical protein CXT67_00400 [Methanobacteriota archaeon]|nr:MAG: hypothetical protein CXT67_00400 [Euryarchaeota archaeon]
MVLPGQLIPSPLRIFRNIGDDSVEETLRAMHLANTVDNTYEWGLGWIRTIVVSIVAVMSVSAMEANSDWNLWELTVEWWYQKVADFGSWITNKFS